MNIAQGFSNKVTVKGGMRKSETIVRGGMINFAGGREVVSWVDANLRRSAFDHSNLFQG